MRRSILSLFAVACVLGSMSAGTASAIEPIVEIKGVKPNDGVFKVAQRGKPIEIRTEKDAAKHFDKEAMAALKKKVDLSKQIVLIFAWQGSGADKLVYDVAESFPEQVGFRIKPGVTDDLRRHVHVFALRANVKWRVR